MAEGREFPFGGLTRFLFLPDINILKLTQATRLSQLGSQRSVPVHPPSRSTQLLSPPIANATGGYRKVSISGGLLLQNFCCYCHEAV
jgi:hypothetical protein